LIDIEGLIACSVCHGEVALEGDAEQRVASCSGCGRVYRGTGGVYDMIPAPLPSGAVERRWACWETLQANGAISYSLVPELNLSVVRRADVDAFERFCSPAGLILDVGCGPQRRPTHLAKASAVVGLDPLLGEQPREFAFVQGLGEYLPFRDATFDQVIYAASLDHLLDPRRGLAEARRCLKPDGRIDLWLDAAQPLQAFGRGRLHRWAVLLAKGARALARHSWLREVGFRRTLAYVATVARLPVPPGAIDCFHWQQLHPEAVAPWLAALRLRVRRREELVAYEGVFLELSTE